MIDCDEVIVVVVLSAVEEALYDRDWGRDRNECRLSRDLERGRLLFHLFRDWNLEGEEREADLERVLGLFGRFRNLRGDLDRERDLDRCRERDPDLDRDRGE